LASGGHFRANYAGYRAVMLGSEVRTACEVQAGAIAASAARQSGTDYRIDSVDGLNRIHTRVSTQTDADYYRERHYHALSIALGTVGGTVKGVKGYHKMRRMK